MKTANSTSLASGQPSTSEQEIIIRASISNWSICNILLGMYTVVYLFTIYLYLKKTDRQQRAVITVTTLLFLLIMGQTGLEWYGIDWTLIQMGASRQTIYIATISSPPPWMHLIADILFFGTFLAADWLMVWRCYHVWGRSWRVILIPSLLLLSELTILLSLICIVSVNIPDITPSVAIILDSLQIGLYSIPAAISLLCSYLISHRIFFASVKNEGSRVGRSRSLRKTIEIVVQSSLTYSVILLCTVALDGVPTPHAERPIKRETAYTYISALLTPISGLVPTLMVARVGLLSTNHNNTTTSDGSRSKVSNIIFRQPGEIQASDEEQDITDQKVGLTTLLGVEDK